MEKRLFFTLIFSMLVFFAKSQAPNGVGINTTFPQATLHVNGNMRVDSVAKNHTSSMFLVRDSTGDIYYRELLFEAQDNFSMCGDTLFDTRDGQQYPTTLIGNQCWMAKNLNYKTPSGSWCYNNDTALCADVYGRAYDWQTMMDGSGSHNSVPSGVAGLCPDGWHVPSLEEFNILREYGVGGASNGGFLKMPGTTYWNSPNADANNYARFNAVGSGRRDSGSFLVGYYVVFWLATQYDNDISWGWRLTTNSGTISTVLNYKNYGLYCRCIKN